MHTGGVSRGGSVAVYRCYYPHTSRDSVSPVCRIFSPDKLPYLITFNPISRKFTLKSEASKKEFYKATQNTKDLEKLFKTNKPLEVQTKKFIKRLNGFINSCFKKVKIETTVDYKLEQLYDKRRYLRSKDDNESNIA